MELLYIVNFLLVLLVITLLFARKCHATPSSQKIVGRCMQALKKGRDRELFDAIEELVEKIAKGIRELNLVEIRTTLQRMRVLPDSFAKVVPQVSERAEISMLDRANFLSSYLLRRLEWLFQEAILHNVEPVAEEILFHFAKISLSLAKVHPTLGQLGLYSIEHARDRAFEYKATELHARASAVLAELAKNLIALSKEAKRESDISLTPFILQVIQSLERGAKSSLQKEGEGRMNVALLMQPFAEIASFLAEEGNKTIPDRARILDELKRILQQLSAIEQIEGV